MKAMKKDRLQRFIEELTGGDLQGDVDPFGPPSPPVFVECLHCKKKYMSDQMRSRDGLWCCPVPGCDGAGYGFDIHKVDQTTRAEW